MTKRTDQQNKYYFKCIVLILGEFLGYHKFEMHEILKDKFIEDKSKELSQAEFQQYCEQIRIWSMQELSVKLPLPNECSKNTLINT
tara:strand:- start:9763 stop:10020 length:258 start_codon:yes stop_codon:yes gene_type:complete